MQPGKVEHAQRQRQMRREREHIQRTIDDQRDKHRESAYWTVGMLPYSLLRALFRRRF